MCMGMFACVCTCVYLLNVLNYFARPWFEKILFRDASPFNFLLVLPCRVFCVAKPFFVEFCVLLFLRSDFCLKNFYVIFG